MVYNLLIKEKTEKPPYNHLTPEEIEEFHRKNISTLIRLYGIRREQEIKDLYQEEKRKLEAKVKRAEIGIYDNVPPFSLQNTTKKLTQKYGEPKKQSIQSVFKEQSHPQRKKGKGLLRFLSM